MATEVAFAKTFLALLDSKPQKLPPDYVEDRKNYPASLPYILPRHPSYKPFSKLRRISPSSEDDASATTTTAAASSSSEPSNANDLPTAPAQAPPTNPAAAATAKVVLRSPRNPKLTYLAGPIPLTTSLGELKAKVAEDLGAPVGKIKFLEGKKPVGDTKLLSDIVSAEGKDVGEQGVVEVELGLMILGGEAVVRKGLGEVVDVTTTTAAAAAPLPVGDGGNDKVEGGGGEPMVVDEPTTTTTTTAAAGPADVLKTDAFWDDLGAFLRQRVGDEAVAGEVLGVFRGAWEGRTA